MSNPTPLFYLVLAAATLMIGMGKGGLGVSFAALATPLMALVLPVNQVLPLVLVIQMVADVFAVGAHWKRWDSRLVKLLIPGAIVGVAIGTLFITRVSPQTLRTTLAVVILLFTGYKVLEPRLTRGSPIARAAGTASSPAAFQALRRRSPTTAGRRSRSTC